MKKILAIDMDGTLLDSKNSISKEQLEFLEILSLNSDFEIVVTTGRPLPGVKHLISKKLFKNIKIIGSNGGFIYSYDEGIITQNIFEGHEIDEINKIGLKNNVGLMLSDIENFYSVTQEKHDIIEYDASINKIEVVYENKQILKTKKKINRIVYFIKSELQSQVVKNIPLSFYQKYNILLSQPYLIDFLPYNTDKYIALKYLASYLNVDLENIIAIGDGHNDINMIKYAGISIAMDNAVQEIKDVADIITKSNDENGVMLALKEYVL